VVPLESFAGQDLLQIHTKDQEIGVAKRRTMQAKFSSMRDVRPVVQPGSTLDAHTTKPDPAGGHATDDYEESKEDDEPKKPADEARVATDCTVEPGDRDKVTEDPQPQATAAPIGDGPPSGPRQPAFCDACSVRHNGVTRQLLC
jgi:hypothetical protein